MKIKEFITEAGFGIGMDLVKPKADNNVYVEWANLIKKNCQPFLKQAKGNVLYRGLGHAKKPFMKKKVRLGDRRPKDMPLRLHRKLNTYFTMKFGEPFRNAMFVTGSEVESMEYGATYIIYPIGDFEFLWSPSVDDLYQTWEDYKPDLYGDLSVTEIEKRLYNAEKEFFIMEIQDDYQDTDLAGAINSSHEIMMRPKQYYAVRNDIHKDIEALL